MLQKRGRVFAVLLHDDLGVLVKGGVVQNLFCILDRLQLIPFVGILAGLEELDEGVIGHVLPGVAEALSLQFDVFVFVLLELLVQRPFLNGWALGVRIQVLHIRKAHVPCHFGTVVSFPGSIRPLGCHIVSSEIEIQRVVEVVEVGGIEAPSSTFLVDGIGIVLHLVVSVHVDAHVSQHIDPILNILLPILSLCGQIVRYLCSPGVMRLIFSQAVGALQRIGERSLQVTRPTLLRFLQQLVFCLTRLCLGWTRSLVLRRLDFRWIGELPRQLC